MLINVGKYGAPANMRYPYDLCWMDQPYCNCLVFSGDSLTGDMIFPWMDYPPNPSGILMIHPIWWIWQFYGESVTFLWGLICFIYLLLQMVWWIYSINMVIIFPGMCWRYPQIWGIFSTCTSFQTECLRQYCRWPCLNQGWCYW